MTWPRSEIGRETQDSNSDLTILPLGIPVCPRTGLNQGLSNILLRLVNLFFK